MELRRSTAAVGLVLLVLLDAALIAWALWPIPTVAGMSSTTPLPAPPIQRQSPSEGDDAPAGTTSTASAESLAPLARLVAGVSPMVAWLADGGDCGHPGRVHVTLDGGASWTSQPAQGSITRIRPSDASAAFVVGGDADCAARVWYTGDRGETWSAAQSASNAWGRSPDDSDVVLRPGGQPVQPCLAGAVLDLIGFSTDDAVVLCRNGGIRTTSDGGATWVTTAAQSGLLAISPTPSGGGAVVGLADHCPGLVVSALEGGRFGAAQCVEDAPYAPGQVAISVAGDVVWLIGGDEVYRAETVEAPFVRVAAWPAL